MHKSDCSELKLQRWIINKEELALQLIQQWIKGVKGVR